MKLLNREQLRKKLESIPVGMKDVLKKEVARGSLVLQNEMRRSIQKGPKTGIEYKRGSGVHQASAPGQPPASDSGVLVANINVRLSSDKLDAKIGVNDVSNVEYARRMELGGKDERGIYIAPRPYIAPAIKKFGLKITRRILKAARQVIASVG